MNVIILGAPGAGKGTQAARIAEKCHLVHISTGDILRKAVADKTPLGLKAESYMKKGELVPDALVVDIIRERLLQSDEQGTILDGFPRTVAQADALKQALSELNTAIDAVVDVEVDEEELVRRLTRRRTCRDCGRIYHLDFDPPKHEGVCNVCGGELYQRDDDKEETVKTRLKVYAEQTAPLIDYYRKAGLLCTVDGKLPIDEVFSQIKDILEVACE